MRTKRPRKKATSQAERKEYALMKALRERDRLMRRAERRGERAERRGEEPVGYRETIMAGGPRSLESAVRGREPIYQDEYDLLARAGQGTPLDYYEQTLLSGVRKGGEFADPCRDGNPGAGASVACSAKKANEVSRQRQGKKTTVLDKMMQRLRGKIADARVTDAPRFNPYNQAEQDMISREMGLPTRGINLTQQKGPRTFSGANINFQ